MWSRSSGALGVFASLVLHGAWLAGLRSEQLERGRAEQVAPAAYEIELALVAEATAAEEPEPARAKLELGGPASSSALDLDAAEGSGGADVSEDRSLLLFSFVSPVTLQDSDLNNLRQNQTQRIATSPLRATQEERRATPHAANAAFLSSGDHGHKERREPAPRDAQSGAETKATAPRAEARPERHDPQSHGDRHTVSSEPAQRESPNTPRGVAHGTGARAQRAAKVAFARPNIDRGPAATPAEAQDAKVRDNHDAELLAALLQRSIVDASTQRAARRSEGIGGASDGRGLSSAGEGHGARARPYLPGPGKDGALNTEDARYVRWFIEQKERVQHELVFPTPRALAKDQGISIYRVVVRRDGRLAGAPRLVRSSGFSDFDDAAVVAIERALPFTPLPEQLLPGESDLALLIPVAFSNPMVQ